MSERPDKDAEDAELHAWMKNVGWIIYGAVEISINARLSAGVLWPYLSDNNRNFHLCWNILRRGHNCLNIIYKIFSPMRTCIQQRNIPFFFVPELTIRWSLIQVLSSATWSFWNQYLVILKKKQTMQTNHELRFSCLHCCIISRYCRWIVMQLQCIKPR